jgi:hypothetical protein
VKLLPSKLAKPVRQFFQREDWLQVLQGYGLLFCFFVLPWIVGFIFPPLLSLGILSGFLLLCSLVFAFYEETKRKIEADEPTYKVTYILFKCMDLVPKVAELMKVIFTSIIGIVLLVAVIGGVIGILVFGWKQLL